MPIIKEEARRKYSEYIHPYQKIIADLQSTQTRVESVIKNGDPGEPYKRLALAEGNLTMVSYNLVMNSLSVTLLGVRNENALNDAKKGCTLAIIQLEKVFTDLLDVPFGDYEESLAATSSFNELKRYELIRKIGLSLSLVKDSYGENNRFKWALVDLDARLATVAKNCLDLRTLVQGMDPRNEGFRERVEFFNLTRRMLKDSADNFRKKFELATNEIGDFRKANSFLGALLRLSVLLGRQKEAEELRRTILVWRRRMEADNKNIEEANRRARVGGGEG